MRVEPTFTATATSTPTFTPTATETPTSVPPTPTPTATPTTLPSWQRLGNAGIELSSLAWDSTENRLYAGDRRTTSAGGVYERTVTDCSLETGLGQSLVDFSVLDIAVVQGRAIAGTFGDRVYLRPTSQGSWSQTPSNMNNYVFGVEWLDTTHAFAGTDVGVYESTDSGIQWNPIGGPNLINTLAVHSGFVWVGTFGEGVFLRSTSGGNFAPFNAGLSGEGLKVWDIVRAGEVVYIGTSNGVFRNDNGVWTFVGFPNATIYSIAEFGGYLYVGGNGIGIYRQPVGNVNENGWEPVSNGVGWQNNYTVRDLLTVDFGIPGCNGGLIAATNDGVWIYRSPN